ncbi:MAG: protein-export chaperone SecB [Pseudomonadota bacterium]
MSEQQTPATPDAQPLFGIEKIYLKDMSLELPNAPQSFFVTEAPEVQVNIHNEASGLPQEGMFEVVLTVTITAKVKDKTIFLVEAAQAGIFQIRNVPQPDLEAVLGTLCPNTLLPYAREVVASLVQRAGFPPVTLQHMNFDVVYQQRMQQMQAQAAAGAAAAPQTH